MRSKNRTDVMQTGARPLKFPSNWSRNRSIVNACLTRHQCSDGSGIDRTKSQSTDNPQFLRGSQFRFELECTVTKMLMSVQHCSKTMPEHVPHEFPWIRRTCN